MYGCDKNISACLDCHFSVYWSCKLKSSFTATSAGYEIDLCLHVCVITWNSMQVEEKWVTYSMNFIPTSLPVMLTLCFRVWSSLTQGSLDKMDQSFNPVTGEFEPRQSKTCLQTLQKSCLQAIRRAVTILRYPQVRYQTILPTVINIRAICCAFFSQNTPRNRLYNIFNLSIQRRLMFYQTHNFQRLPFLCLYRPAAAVISEKCSSYWQDMA